jgi:hypothetical protein
MQRHRAMVGTHTLAFRARRASDCSPRTEVGEQLVDRFSISADGGTVRLTA